jgi:hypothetical protein
VRFRVPGYRIRGHARILGVSALIVAALIVLGSGSPPASAAAGWTSYGRIEELSTDYVGRILIRMEVEENPSDCKDKTWFYRDLITGSEFMFRLLLEAASRDTPVRLYVTGLCDLNRYSEISKVRIAP